MVKKSKIAFSLRLLCTICMVVLMGSSVFAQKIDTTNLSIKPKAKIVSKVPQLKTNLPNYRPTGISYNPSIGSNSSAPVKSGKILTVLKVYPNPVIDQINISLRLDKETLLSVKITDMLGNDVMTLANERSPAGEQTKTYTIPNRLNAGIYLLKVVAGGEPKFTKISVL